jgi:hypothetical protein
VLPYAEITENADRRWTSRLMERLVAPDLPDGELDKLVGAVQAVSDPRSFAELESILCHCARGAHVREAAGAILRGLHHVTFDVSPDKLRDWWLEGDAVLRKLSLSFMDGARCPDIVMSVAADAEHSLQSHALDQMDFWFDLPHQQAVKITGLSHPAANVRVAAAKVLLWDEPIEAERPLLQASGDLVPEVAAEVANTLEYYPSVCVLSRLHELMGHANDKVRDEAADSFQSIRNQLLIRLGDRDRRLAEHIRRWLQAVWDVLAFSDEELRPAQGEDRSAPQKQALDAMPLEELWTLLVDPEVSPLVLGDRMRSNNWSSYNDAERRRLRPMLLTHADQLVREQAAWVFAAWRDTDGLLELLRAADFCVRKNAMYNLGQLQPTWRIADVAWKHLDLADTLGIHATETLATFVRHAASEVAVRRLSWVGADHGRRENVRAAAVHHLASLGAGDQIGQLVGLLSEPPAVTWALHLALLEAITALKLATPDISFLRDVDDLYVQVAMARIGA